VGEKLLKKKKNTITRWLITIIILLTATITVQALPYCTDTKVITQNCTYTTPVLNCTTPEYEIINNTGQQWDTNNLSLLRESPYGKVYNLNFTQPNGEYLIILCDGTTREVIAETEDKNNMILAALIIVPMILSLVLVFGAASMSSDDHATFRIFLLLLSMIPFYVSLHFSMIGVVQFYNLPELQNSIANVNYWFVLMFVVMVTYFIIYAIIKAVHTAAQKKEERFEY
jgi:hypothetical protein